MDALESAAVQEEDGLCVLTTQARMVEFVRRALRCRPFPVCLGTGSHTVYSLVL